MTARAALAASLTLGAAMLEPCDLDSPVTVTRGQERVALGTRLAVLDDPQKSLTLEDVQRPEVCGRFTRASSTSDLDVFHRGRYWLRFRVEFEEGSPRGWLLLVPFPGFERICAHWPRAGGEYESRCTGIAAPASSRPIQHNRFLFPVPEATDPGQPVFVEAESRAPWSMQVELVRAEAFLSEDQRLQFLGGMFNGVLFATALYNLIFFLGVRDRASLFYALHLLGLGLAMLMFEGRLYGLIWPWLRHWSASLPTTLLGTSFLFGCLYARDFLLTRRRAPLLDRGLVLAAIPAALVPPVSLVSIRLAEQVAALAALCFVVGLVSAGIVLARRGDRPAIYLLFGLSAFLAGVVVVSLRVLGVSIPQGWGVPVTRFGLTIASVAISVGLGRRVAELRRERDRAEHALAQLEESLRRKEHMSFMGSLLAGVAHEVRNPLFGISSTVDALQVRLGRVEGFPKYLSMLRSQVDRLAQLMNDLLEYGRPQALDLRRQDISSLIAEARLACESRARKGGVAIETLTPPEPPPVVVDRKRMVQVFVNLLENAVAHSSRGGRVVMEAMPSDGPGGPLVATSVRDFGRGFAEADLPHVFEPFFSRRRGGTGLGLSIVQRIIEQHGGRVEARNALGGGAEVVVWLPLDGPDGTAQ